MRLLEARIGDVKALEAKQVRHDDEQQSSGEGRTMAHWLCAEQPPMILARDSGTNPSACSAT